MKPLLAIDPGKYTGLALFVPVGDPAKYMLEMYGLCFPSNSFIVQNCLREILEPYMPKFFPMATALTNTATALTNSETWFSSLPVEPNAESPDVVIEDQRHGQMGARSFITLIRARERWQCLAEVAGCSVAELMPGTWQSWAYKRMRQSDAKAASIQRVNTLYGLEIKKGTLLENAADAINMGECYLNGHVTYGHLAAPKIWRPRFSVLLETTYKGRDGTIQQSTSKKNIIGATKTKYVLEDSELEFRRTPTKHIPVGSARREIYEFSIRAEDLIAFETFIAHGDIWPDA